MLASRKRTQIATDGDGVDDPRRNRHDAPDELHRPQDALRPRQIVIPQDAEQPQAY